MPELGDRQRIIARVARNHLATREGPMERTVCLVAGATAVLGCRDQRNVAERGINALKRWRGIAMRHEKRACNYRAAGMPAALWRWLA